MNDTSTMAAKPMQIFQSPIVWLCITLVTMGLIVIGLFATCHTTPKSEPELAPLAPSGGGPGYSSNMYNVDNLKLIAMIGQGKYGTVWKGMVNEQAVAVKIFPSQHKQYFQNERNIYSLPLMQTASILQYFGCDTRRTLNDSIEYILVLSLAPLGCLQDWLLENTSSFEVFTKMAKSIARGLSHLHSAQRKDDQEKPCVCHRDLNTRNILVKSDLSCCISDFGFALKTFGPRYEWKGEITLAETKSINEVGTLRYMAPEVLEGAVNLRDCETALKQIDVYAMGLVLWELCTRCHDWYANGQQPPPYKSPYEAEAGKKPSFEHMQVLISRHKARPLFPASWGGDAAAKIARETCEDCWDHDAEARLTALCVEERVHELTAVYSRATSSCGSSPALSTTNNFATTTIITTSVPVTTANFYTSTDTTIITPPNQIISNIITTTDSMGSTTNNGRPLVTHKNQTIFSHQQIQAFQGRNPCMERNLMPQVVLPQKVFVERTNKHTFAQSGDNSFARLDSDISVEQLIAGVGTGSANSDSACIVPNTSVMGKGFPKQMNADRKLKGWYGVRAMIEKKLFKRYTYRMQSNPVLDDKSNLVDNTGGNGLTVSVSASPVRDGAGHIIDHIPTTVTVRPKNLDLPTQQSKNTISLVNDIDPSNESSKHFKVAPGDNQSRSFAIIKQNPQIIVSRSANSMKNNTVEMNDERQIKRQRSLEMFHEVFGSKGSIDRLRDPSQRVKTPGDVPPSVRKIRASKTLSLYDDRMMDTSSRNSL